jgi:hypothetical protein
MKTATKYKIGISSRVAHRLSNIRTSTPGKVHLIFESDKLQRDRALKIEKELHNKYHHKKTSGEWFKLSDTELEEVTTYLSQLELSEEETEEKEFRHTSAQGIIPGIKGVTNYSYYEALQSVYVGQKVYMYGFPHFFSYWVKVEHIDSVFIYIAFKSVFAAFYKDTGLCYYIKQANQGIFKNSIENHYYEGRLYPYRIAGTYKYTLPDNKTAIHFGKYLYSQFGIETKRSKKEDNILMFDFPRNVPAIQTSTLDWLLEKAMNHHKWYR